MTKPQELYDQALRCREEAMSEPKMDAKRALYRKALELTQTADKMTRDDVTGFSISARRNVSS